jgi:uncharacterized protein YeaO (DUF488 family)
MLDEIREKCGTGPVTFVYAARDEERNSALILKNVLEAQD